MNPSGYIGSNGLFRIKPTGDNERALRIVKTNGDGTISELKPAPNNFIKPIYNIDKTETNIPDAFSLQTNGINPNNYIRIPQRFTSKYSTKTYGANIDNKPIASRMDVITTLPEDDRESITVSDFESVKKESVDRTYIDEVEIEE